MTLKQMPMRRTLLWIGLTLALVACNRAPPAPITPGPASTPAAAWSDIEAAARGQEVFFNAWAGDERVNAFIAWASAELAQHYGVKLTHVKTQDTAEAIARILAEKAAGRVDDGSVDLLWINGENFAALKANAMLFGPFVERLPIAPMIDFAGQPSFSSDFTIPVEGLEAPWGLSLFVFTHDAARLADPPRDFPALLAWAKANPGRFTYPAPPNFTGSSFLKQAMLAIGPADLDYARPPDEDGFARASAALFDYLDALHPVLWRKGATFPQSGPAQRQLLADGEVDLTMSFNPSEAASAVALGQLPASVATYGFRSGSLTNAHFLAIPANARAKEAALVAINFLLSPEAQARKADIRFWGDASALDLDKLSGPDRALFDALGENGNLARWGGFEPALSEPHPDWMERIERAWAERYAR